MKERNQKNERKRDKNIEWKKGRPKETNPYTNLYREKERKNKLWKEQITNEELTTERMKRTDEEINT